MKHSSSCGPNGIKFHGISAENKALRICQNDSKTLAEISEFCFSWLQSGVYTKVLEFTLRVNMTLGDFAVSVIMFTFQCAVNNGVRKHDIFNPSFEFAVTLHYSRTESVFACFKYGN